MWATLKEAPLMEGRSGFWRFRSLWLEGFLGWKGVGRYELVMVIPFGSQDLGRT